MIIEFFGFPGSGKTTICSKFIKKLRKNNHVVVRGTFDHLGAFSRIVCKLFYSFLCLFINPKFFLENLLFFIRSKKGLKTMVTDFLNVTYLYARYAFLKDSDKIIVFDQGLIQAYWSVLAFAGLPGKEYNYNILFKNVDHVIILELDWEENLDRLFLRDDHKSRVQKETQTMDFYFEQFLKVKEILKELDLQYKLSLDSGLKVKKNVKKIRKRIIAPIQ